MSVFWRPTRNSPYGLGMPAQAWRANRRALVVRPVVFAFAWVACVCLRAVGGVQAGLEREVAGHARTEVLGAGEAQPAAQDRAVLQRDDLGAAGAVHVVAVLVHVAVDTEAAAGRLDLQQR